MFFLQLLTRKISWSNYCSCCGCVKGPRWNIHFRPECNWARAEGKQLWRVRTWQRRQADVELTDSQWKDSTAGNDFQWWKYLCGCIKQKQPILAVILWDPQKWFKVKSADGCWHLSVFHQAPGDSASIPVSSVCVLSLLAASPVFVWATFSAQVFVDKKVTEVSVFMHD